MSPIKRLPDKDLGKFVDIVAQAYPGFGIKSKEDHQRILKWLKGLNKIDKGVVPYGLYRNGKLIGGYRLFDFDMTLFESRVSNGGGGLLAIDLKYKKEHAARELMEFFIKYYRRRGYPLACLFAFRPDFYFKMGFGYGAKLFEYAFAAEEFPAWNDKRHIVDINEKEVKNMMACSDRYARKTHGMFLRRPYEYRRFFRPGKHTVGYKNGSKIEGYINFEFKEGKGSTMFRQNLVIDEMVWEHREAFKELIAFLRSQLDQINRVVWVTSHDFMHFLPRDPRSETDSIIPIVGHPTARAGIGIMHRVINVERLFAALKKHDFGGETVRLKMNIKDDFLPENSGARIAVFDKGKVTLQKSGRTDCDISLGIAEFSSVIIGAVDFADLYEIGKAEISDERYLGRVNRLFHSETKPLTLSMF